jgi:hypothetical protein
MRARTSSSVQCTERYSGVSRCSTKRARSLPQVGYGDVVAVEERHPEVAVAEVERVPEAGGVLVHEAEHAVVAAGLDAELLQLGPERRVGFLLDGLLLGGAAAADAQHETFLGGLEPEVQLVLDRLAVDGQHLVAGRPAERRGEGTGFNRCDADRHGTTGVERGARARNPLGGRRDPAGL